MSRMLLKKVNVGFPFSLILKFGKRDTRFDRLVSSCDEATNEAL